MFKYKTYDVLKNRHHGNIIMRLLPEVHNNGSFGIWNVDPSGYVDCGSSSPEDWEKISLYKWYLACITLLVKQLCWRWKYISDKHLGMVNPIDANDYWKIHNHYKNFWRPSPVKLYGYLSSDNNKIVDLPVWREVSFKKDFETPLSSWFFRRLKHLIP